MWWLAASVALGCGGMFGPDEATVFSASQQAIFERHADHVTVDYLVDTSGELAEFGWVIPLPGTFRSVEERDPALFDELRELTEPRPVWHGEDSGGGGCSGGAKAGGDGLRGSFSTSNSVTVIDQGTTGLFDYAVLEADSLLALSEWLEVRGWSVEDNIEAVDLYIQEGGWQFLALEAAADTAPGPNAAVQSAITVAYEGQTMVFPARMTVTSQAPTQSTTLYVIGDERATMNGWAVGPLEDVEEVGDAWSLEQVLVDASADEATYTEVWSDAYEDRWLTRFDTVTDSALHDQDVNLNYLGGTIPLRPRIDLYESEEAREQSNGGCAVGRAGIAGWSWLLVLALVGRVRRN